MRLVFFFEFPFVCNKRIKSRKYLKRHVFVSHKGSSLIRKLDTN